MKGIILAGGYATRMEEVTKNKIPKHLLSVGGRPMIEKMMSDITQLGEIDKFFLVTNDKYSSHFEEWIVKTSWKNQVTIVNDGTNQDGEKLGSIGDINFVLEQYDVQDSLYIFGGDNYTNLDYQLLIDKFYQTKKPVIAGYNLNSGVDWNGLTNPKQLVNQANDIDALAKQMGQLKLDDAGKITEFAEKKSPAISTVVSTLFYVLPKSTIPLIGEMSKDKIERDKAGNLIDRLVKDDVYAVTHAGEWFDIGNMKEYERVLKLYPNEYKK